MRFTQEEIEIVSQNTISDSMSLLGCCKRRVCKIRQYAKDLEYFSFFEKNSEKSLVENWEDSRMESVFIRPVFSDEKEKEENEACERAKETLDKEKRIVIDENGFANFYEIAELITRRMEGKGDDIKIVQAKDLEKEELPEELSEDAFVEDETISLSKTVTGDQLLAYMEKTYFKDLMKNDSLESNSQNHRSPNIQEKGGT